MHFLKKHGVPLCKQSGVYSITNTANGKVYIGSAVSIRGRLLYHRSYLRRGKHDNKHLQRSWDRHGEASFRFDVLETCDAGSVIEREQYWIDALGVTDRSKGYNICPAAGSAMRGRTHSEETRAKMSVANKGKIPTAATKAAAEANRGKERSQEIRDKIAASNAGKPKSAEHNAAIKANHWSKRSDAAEIAERSAAANRGKRHSEEHKARIAEAGRRRWAKLRGETTDDLAD